MGFLDWIGRVRAWGLWPKARQPPQEEPSPPEPSLILIIGYWRLGGKMEIKWTSADSSAVIRFISIRRAIELEQKCPGSVSELWWDDRGIFTEEFVKTCIDSFEESRSEWDVIPPEELDRE